MMNMKEKSEYQNLISSMIERIFAMHIEERMLKDKESAKEKETTDKEKTKKKETKNDLDKEKVKEGDEKEKDPPTVINYNTFRTFFKSVSEIDKETFINVLSDTCTLQGSNS